MLYQKELSANQFEPDPEAKQKQFDNFIKNTVPLVLGKLDAIANTFKYFRMPNIF